MVVLQVVKQLLHKTFTQVRRNDFHYYIQHIYTANNCFIIDFYYNIKNVKELPLFFSL